MRERRIKYDKYVIILSESNPFESDEFVKILRKSDLEKIRDLIKSLKTKGEQLRNEINDPTILLETQRNYITLLESSSNKKQNKNKVNTLKKLIKI